MTEPGPITLAYLAAHPLDAARVMDTLDPADLATFLATVPVRLAAPPLAAISPWRAGRCLAAFEPERAAAVIEAIPSDRRLPCLRAIGEPAREGILERLPRRLARTVRHQLRYPAALVGAVMDGDVVSLPPDARMADARAALQAAADRYIAQLYVVDASARPIGVIPVAAVIQARPDQAVQDLVQRNCTVIAADKPLSHVATDRDWHDHAERPVVDSRGRLVGSLALVRLLAARDRAVGAPSSGPGPAMVLAQAFASSVGGLTRLALTLMFEPGRSGNGR